jgi:hypothetical protein
MGCQGPFSEGARLDLWDNTLPKRAGDHRVRVTIGKPSIPVVLSRCHDIIMREPHDLVAISLKPARLLSKTYPIHIL